MPSVVFTKQVSDEKTRTTLLTGLAGYETYQIRMLAYTKSGDGGKSAFVEVITPEGSKKLFLMYLLVLFLFPGM